MPALLHYLTLFGQTKNYFGPSGHTFKSIFRHLVETVLLEKARGLYNKWLKQHTIVYSVQL